MKQQDFYFLLIAIFSSRIWSMIEHIVTRKRVDKIEVYVNGEMEKKLEEAKEQGRQEERDKNKSK